MMALNKEAWLEVADALDSGDYVQIKGHLNRNGCYCAAGVVCELFYKRLGLRKEVDDFGFGYYGRSFVSDIITPIEIKNFMETDREAGSDLVGKIMGMNDFDGSSFSEIAEVIRDRVSQED